MADFKLEQNDKWTALFVNSNVPPTERTPTNCYEYNISFSGKLIFYRLYFYKYGQPIENPELKHGVFVWEKIEVKPHCVFALKQMIDALESVQEFLK